MTNTYDINNPVHRKLLAITARINVAASNIMLKNAVQDLMMAVEGEQMEIRVMASSLATAAVCDALSEAAKEYVHNNPDMVSELDCAIAEERTKLQKKLDNLPAGIKTPSMLSTACLCEIEDELKDCETADDFVFAMEKVHPLMVDSGGLATIRFVERALAEILVRNIIPDYLRMNPDDDMTAAFFSLWQNLDSLCGASTISGCLGIDDEEYYHPRRC